MFFPYIHILRNLVSDYFFLIISIAIETVVLYTSVAIYALQTESFCLKILTIWKVFAFSASAPLIQRKNEFLKSDQLACSVNAIFHFLQFQFQILFPAFCLVSHICNATRH